MDNLPDDKRARLLLALERGMTMIHVDARRQGVIIPSHLKGEMRLLLNLSYRFIPRDLVVTEDAIHSTLTFSSEQFRVTVPWGAVYGIMSHVTKELWAFPESVPPELIRHVTGLKRGSALQAVPGEADSPADARPAEEAVSQTRRGFLRLVK